jgi:RNA polymerase sigma factor (sigma-70 family)
MSVGGLAEEGAYPVGEDNKLQLDGIVYVVDDDPAAHDYLRWLLGGTGCTVESYDDPREFLAAFHDRGPACLISDLCMPGLSGLDLQAMIALRDGMLPVIMISGHGEVATAVSAMRAGAVDFLEKPFDPKVFLERVRAALESSHAAHRAIRERAEVAARLQRLSPRQRSVLEHLKQGKSTKEIAEELGLSPRTVDVHRFRLMHALEATSLPELFRMVMLIHDTGAPRPRLVAGSKEE